MENKKIIIAGGTGFIGQEMIKYFGKKNDLIILTRQRPDEKTNRNKYNALTRSDLTRVKYVKWNAADADEWAPELDNADIIINLAGKTVNCRYTKKNKSEIFSSRTNATMAIAAAINQCTHPPKLWINAASATIYRHATDRPQDEYTGEFHPGFSVQVCQEWERSFFETKTPATRKVALRMAITLGPGGVMIPYFNLLKFGLGGRQGSGKQMYSWVHIDDTCRIIEWIETHHTMEGVYNCCAPHPVTNKEFMKTLRKATRQRIGLPAYEWMLRLGARLIGTEVELVLKSRWVLPAKLLESGFVFKYPFLREAIQDIISKVPRRQYHLF